MRYNEHGEISLRIPLHLGLVVFLGCRYYSDMSAAELLRHFKALPPREREKFVLAVLTLVEDTPACPKKPSRRVKWPDVEARSKRIFGDRVLPNLILVERDEAEF